MFEKSVDGEAYDLEKYGQYFRPAGVSANQISQPSASKPAPVEQATETAKVDTTPESTAQPAAQPTGDSAKRAEDILKLIRSRQQK